MMTVIMMITNLRAKLRRRELDSVCNGPWVRMMVIMTIYI